LIKSEDEEVFDQFPDLHMDLIREAITGLAVCYNQNPDGINFFKAEGEAIVLVPSPYFLFEEALRNKTWFNYTEFNFSNKGRVCILSNREYKYQVSVDDSIGT
jgi:hypothetical protein